MFAQSYGPQNGVRPGRSVMGLMRRGLLIVLVLATMLSLAACGKKKGDGTLKSGCASPDELKSKVQEAFEAVDGEAVLALIHETIRNADYGGEESRNAYISWFIDEVGQYMNDEDVTVSYDVRELRDDYMAELIEEFNSKYGIQVTEVKNIVVIAVVPFFGYPAQMRSYIPILKVDGRWFLSGERIQFER